MAGVNGRSLLLLGACIALALHCALGTTYDVGGTSGWIIPTSNAQLYTSWLSGKTFKVGDKLNFNFTTNQHNVEEVTKANYASCSSTGALANYSTGPATVTLNKMGNHYFICGIPTHCTSGQKIELNVVAANATSPASSPSPSPSTSPSPSSSTAPSSSAPPSVSATPSAQTPTSSGTPSGTPTGNNSSASRLSTSAVTACISILCGAATLFFFL